MEETIVINGHTVKIKYAAQNDPCALENIRKLLEQQLVVQKTP